MPKRTMNDRAETSEILVTVLGVKGAEIGLLLGYGYYDEFVKNSLVELQKNID